jgi:hypothetical protein
LARPRNYPGGSGTPQQPSCQVHQQVLPNLPYKMTWRHRAEVRGAAPVQGEGRSVAQGM